MLHLPIYCMYDDGNNNYDPEYVEDESPVRLGKLPTRIIFVI